MIYRIINMANLRSNLKHLCLGSDRGNWTSQENKSTWQKWPHAFICFSIFGYCDQTLALVFYILHTEYNRRQYTFHNHFRMAHCYLSRCNPPIKKTKRKNIFLKEEHFIVWISKLCPVDPKIFFIQFLPWQYKTVNISK